MMKRIFNVISVAAIAAVSLLCTSCFKETETDYKFSYTCEYMIEDEAVVKTVLDYFKTVANGYFASTETYYGTSSEACNLALKSFESNYEAIDGEYIKSLLKEGEYVYLVLTCTNNNCALAYLVWNKSSENTENKE